MSEENFGVRVLVRDAIAPEDRAKGMKICRSAVHNMLEGKRLEDFITEIGLNRQVVQYGALALADLIRVLGSFGASAHLEGLGFLSPVVSGKFTKDDPDWKSKIDITYHIRLEKGLQQGIKERVHFYTTPMQPAVPILKRIQRVSDRGDFVGELAVRETFLINGSRMKFDRENPQEGVFFEDIDSPSQSFRIDSAKPDVGLIFCQVPAGVIVGRTYRLIVRAKMYRCKTVHEAIFPSAITITS